MMFEHECYCIEVEEGEIFDVPEDFRGIPDEEHEYYGNEVDFIPINYLCQGRYQFKIAAQNDLGYDRYMITPIGEAIIKYK